MSRWAGDGGSVHDVVMATHVSKEAVAWAHEQVRGNAMRLAGVEYLFGPIKELTEEVATRFLGVLSWSTPTMSLSPGGTEE